MSYKYGYKAGKKSDLLNQPRIGPDDELKALIAFRQKQSAKVFKKLMGYYHRRKQTCPSSK